MQTLAHSDELRWLTSQFSIGFPQNPALMWRDSSKVLLLIGYLDVYQFFVFCLNKEAVMWLWVFGEITSFEADDRPMKAAEQWCNKLHMLMIQ